MEDAPCLERGWAEMAQLRQCDEWLAEVLEVTAETMESVRDGKTEASVEKSKRLARILEDLEGTLGSLVSKVSAHGLHFQDDCRDVRTEFHSTLAALRAQEAALRPP